MKLEVTYNGNSGIEVNISSELAETLNMIKDVKGGQFAFVEEHVSGVIGENKCVKPYVSSILFHVRPNYRKYLKVKKANITGITLDDIDITPEIVNKTKDIQADFEAAKNQLIESIDKSIDGDTESDGYRIGANLCYAHYKGYRLHLTTASTKEDGKTVQRPVTAENGLFTVNSIMLPFYTVNRKDIENGEWLPTNSRVITLIKNQIEKKIRVYAWKNFSLGKGNFKEFHIDSKTIYGKVRNWQPTVNDENTAVICDLSMLPMQELAREAEQAEQAEQV